MTVARSRATGPSWSLGSELSVAIGACPILEEALGALLGPCRPAGRRDAGETIELELVPREPAGWMLQVNRIPVLRVRSADQLAPALEGLLVGWAVRTRAGCLALHGAGVAIEGRTVLLVGTSGAGKSSTCLSLALRGARYLGDEVVFARAVDLVLEPFPKAITLKRGSFQLVPPSKSHADAARGPIRYFLPRDRAPIDHAAPPPTLIVFPRYGRDQDRTSVTWVRPEPTALRLVEQTFGGAGRLPDTFQVLARLSAEGAWSIDFSEAADACEQIEELARAA